MAVGLYAHQPECQAGKRVTQENVQFQPTSLVKEVKQNISQPGCVEKWLLGGNGPAILVRGGDTLSGGYRFPDAQVPPVIIRWKRDQGGVKQEAGQDDQRPEHIAAD